jgi:hypothetical protein
MSASATHCLMVSPRRPPTNGPRPISSRERRPHVICSANRCSRGRSRCPTLRVGEALSAVPTDLPMWPVCANGRHCRRRRLKYATSLTRSATAPVRDWVILSACNTAAGSAKSAESLSGLARAFFYAGARSLLVSHWSVDSFATEALITDAVAKLKSDPGIGRAEALRRSMLAMIDNGETYQAHPAYWAPFVLVGEGGASR